MFLLGLWVFMPIGDLDFNILTRVISVVTVFLIIVLFLPISKKYVKVILAIILSAFWAGGAAIYLYHFIFEKIMKTNPFQ